VNPRQLSLIIVLGLISHAAVSASEPSEQVGGWRGAVVEQTQEPAPGDVRRPAANRTSPADAPAGSTLTGKLYRNSADRNGAVPYVVLDRFGVVRGYVAAAGDVDLESSVGHQVSLQGSIKTLPGGDMPLMVCERVVGNRTDATSRSVEPRSNAARRQAVADGNQAPREVAPPPSLPTRTDMSADPAPRTAAVVLHEVVLQPQPAPADDNPQDDRPRPRPRRTRIEATNYQETVPAPVPMGTMRGVPAMNDPELEPSPMVHGPMMSQGPMMSTGPMMSEEPMVGHGGGCETCGNGSGGCGDCGPCCDNAFDDTCWGPHPQLFCVGPTGLWVKTDFLQWWEKGTHVPPLVTTGPSTAQPGYIGEAGTIIDFGNDYINNKSEAGGRIQAGMWLNRCLTVGFEGEYFALAEQDTDYYIWSDGNPIVSRPFYDTSINQENIEKVAFPRGNTGSIDGAIDIGMTTRFHGAGGHFVFTVCREDGCWTDDCSCTSYHDMFRAMVTAGYRYLYLEDQLGITETLTSTTPQPVDPTNPTGAQGVAAFLINDQFNTQNTFSGGDLGMKFEFQRNRWYADAFPRIALGSTHSVVDINGSTRTTSPAGVETTSVGGLLALPTNIGHFTTDSFSVVPEINLNVGYQFTKHTRVVVGYDFLYWSNVARAGEQIDRSVNSTSIPNSGVTPTGDTTHPAFGFQQTGFWTQGINVGIDCRW
jgi:hypothetical protein